MKISIFFFNVQIIGQFVKYTSRRKARYRRYVTILLFLVVKIRAKINKPGNVLKLTSSKKSVKLHLG